jgi:HTH-type transcriptional regulator / antitoxin HigA
MTRKLTPTVGKVYGKHQDRYLELIGLFPLRRIETEQELDAATRVIDMLIDQEHRTKAEDDYLDVLSDLTMAYEEVHYPMGEVSDADMLKFLIETKGTTQTQVAKGAGIAESTISEVLSGKRKLNRSQIGKLARYFRVEPGVFEFDG